MSSDRTIHDSNLLIGGPGDGRRIQARDGYPVLRVADEQTGAVSSYHRETLAGETAAYSLWRWEGLSLDATLEALLGGYREPLQTGPNR